MLAGFSRGVARWGRLGIAQCGPTPEDRFQSGILVKSCAFLSPRTAGQRGRLGMALWGLAGNDHMACCFRAAGERVALGIAG
jgi:hypothetical protein